MARRGHAFDIRASDLGPYTPDDPLTDRLLRSPLRGPFGEWARALGFLLMPRARQRRSKLLGRNEAFARVITEAKGCRTFLDATKIPERVALLRRLSGFELSVLHLVRDPRAVVHSMIRNQGADVEAAARSWSEVNRRSERAAALVPATRRLRLRYEDLCAAPAAALQVVTHFLGLEPFAAPPTGTVREDHVIGNRMRLAPIASITLDESWRQGLTPSVESVARRLTATTAARFGYAIGPG